MANTVISAELNIRGKNNDFVTIYPVTLDKNVRARIGNDTTVKNILNTLTDYIEVENKTEMFALTSINVHLNTYIFVKDINTLYQVSDLANLNSDAGYTEVPLTNFRPSIAWTSIRNRPLKVSDLQNDSLAEKDHNHDASNVFTTGTVPILRGGTGANTILGALINLGLVNINGGAKIGTGATTVSDGNGGAVGQKSSTINGGAVGSSAYSEYGGAVGSTAYTTTGGAVGSGAKSSDGFAGGYNAKANAIGSVQLGEGENNTAHSLKFRDTIIVETVENTKKLNPSLLQNTTVIYDSLVATGLSTSSLTCIELLSKVPLRTSIFFTHSTTHSAYITDAPASNGVFNFYKGNSNSDGYIKFIDRDGNEYVASLIDGYSTKMSKWSIQTPVLTNNITFTISPSANDDHNSPLIGSKTTFKTIQAILNILPKNLNGKIVYIRIPPNITVSDVSPIIIQNFYNGRIDFVMTAADDPNITDPASFPIINTNISILECDARIVFRKVHIKGRTNGVLAQYSNAVVHIASSSNVVFDIVHINGEISSTSKVDIGVLTYSSHLVFNSATILNCGASCIRNHNNANYSTMSTVNLVGCRLINAPTGIYNNAGLFTLHNITYDTITTQTITERGGQFFRQT